MTLLLALDRYWFAPERRERPALLRIMLGAYALYYLGRRYRVLLRISRSDPAMFAPVGAVTYLNAPVSPSAFRRILWTTLALNVAFLLGWRHSVSGPAFAGSLLWLLSYRNSWSMIFHNDNAMVLHALILGCAPSADALSLDARRTRARQRTAPAASWRYGWPIRLLSASTTLTYFVAGVAKVAGPSGWRWYRGESLKRQVAVDGLRKDLLGDGSPYLTRRIYRHDQLFQLMGIGTLILELGAPFALANQRLGQVWAANCLAMHWGVKVIMGITFRYQLCGLIFASFIEPDRLYIWLRNRHSAYSLARKDIAA